MAEAMVKMKMFTTIAGPRGSCEPFNPKKKANQYYYCPPTEARGIVDGGYGEIVTERIPEEAEDFSRLKAAAAAAPLPGVETAAMAAPKGRRGAPREGDEA